MTTTQLADPRAEWLGVARQTYPDAQTCWNCKGHGIAIDGTRCAACRGHGFTTETQRGVEIGRHSWPIPIAESAA